MTSYSAIGGLIGGGLIGLAAIGLMLGIGRIAGISGILVTALVQRDAKERSWRLAFLAGLPLGAVLVTLAGYKDWSGIQFVQSVPATIAAGFLVGLGAVLGSGCTSGHGICGLARFSGRSLVATATFMTTGIATVFVARHLM